MTGALSKNFHGVGIGPLSKILAVKGLGLMTVLSTHEEVFGQGDTTFVTYIYQLSDGTLLDLKKRIEIERADNDLISF